MVLGQVLPLLCQMSSILSLSMHICGMLLLLPPERRLRLQPRLKRMLRRLLHPGMQARLCLVLRQVLQHVWWW